MSLSVSGAPLTQDTYMTSPEWCVYAANTHIRFSTEVKWYLCIILSPLALPRFGITASPATEVPIVRLPCVRSD